MPKKIAPLIGDPLNVDQLSSPPSSSRKSKTVVEVAGVIIMVGGLLVMVFNILFIYFGMHSGWYYFQDSLGTELKVISIGEGIIAGMFYIIFGLVTLCVLSSGNDTAIIAVNIVTGLIGVTLVLVNACQMGLVSWYVPGSVEGANHPDMELVARDKVETQQMVVLGLELATHLVVTTASIVTVLGVNNMSGPNDFVN